MRYLPDVMSKSFTDNSKGWFIQFVSSYIVPDSIA